MYVPIQFSQSHRTVCIQCPAFVHNDSCWGEPERAPHQRYCIVRICVQVLVDYASIILGIIGVPEHQKLCWHNRYTFLIRWSEHCILAISFDQVHCILILRKRIFFRGLHAAFSNARIQPPRKARILLVTTLKLLSFLYAYV